MAKLLVMLSLQLGERLSQRALICRTMLDLLPVLYLTHAL